MADEREPPLLCMSNPFWPGKEKHLIYNINNKNLSQSLNVDVLLGKEIQGSSYGWLVLVGDQVHENRESCLFNPTSGDIIALPDMEDDSQTRCVLSKPPTEPDCHILFNSIDDCQQWFCRIGDHEFVEVPSQTERVLKAIGSFQGKIYGLVMNIPGNHELVSIHFVDKTLELRPVLGTRPWRIPQLSPPQSRPGQNLHQMWLVESAQGGHGGAELLLVQRTYTCKYLRHHPVEFRVFRIDMEEMEFVELQSIGERAIFIGHYGTVFCRSSSVGELKANSIYYTEQHERNLYVFNLEDRSTTSMLPSSIASRNSFSSWVEHSSCHEFLTR